MNSPRHCPAILRSLRHQPPVFRKLRNADAGLADRPRPEGYCWSASVEPSLMAIAPSRRTSARRAIATRVSTVAAALQTGTITDKAGRFFSRLAIVEARNGLLACGSFLSCPLQSSTAAVCGDSEACLTYGDAGKVRVPCALAFFAPVTARYRSGRRSRGRDGCDARRLGCFAHSFL